MVTTTPELRFYRAVGEHGYATASRCQGWPGGLSMVLEVPLGLPGCLNHTALVFSPSSECFRILKEFGLASTCDSCRPKLRALVPVAPWLSQNVTARTDSPTDPSCQDTLGADSWTDRAVRKAVIPTGVPR